MSNKKIKIIIFLLGVFGLIIGGLIYVLDRPLGSAIFLSFIPIKPLSLGIFGSVGNYLPSGIHAFSFSLMTICFFPLEKKHIFFVGGFWIVVNLIFEFGQKWGIFNFYCGTFSFADIVAVIIGGILFCLTLTLIKEIYYEKAG